MLKNLKETALIAVTTVIGLLLEIGVVGTLTQIGAPPAVVAVAAIEAVTIPVAIGFLLMREMRAALFDREIVGAVLRAAFRPRR